MEKGLCEICAPKQWKTISTDVLTKSGYPVYGANGVIGYYSEFNHKDPTLLITCRGATCGTLNICKPYSYVNGNAMALDNLSEEVDIQYLYYYLLHRGLSDVITGSAQPQIVKQSLEKVKVVYPILSEQCKIVEVLEKVSDLIAKRQRQLDKLDFLVKARFVEMFGDPVSNPKNWPLCPLCDCLIKIESGKSFVCTNEARAGIAPGILKLSAATYGDYRPEENKAMIDVSMFVDSAEVHADDLLFTRKNTPELVGMSTYVFETPEKLMMPDLIFRLDTNRRCNKIFLWKLINHDSFRSKIKALSSGSAKSMSNISKERLGNLQIIVPPIELQGGFDSFVRQVYAERKFINCGLEKLETLKKVLMHEYFGG